MKLTKVEMVDILMRNFRSMNDSAAGSEEYAKAYSKELSRLLNKDEQQLKNMIMINC